MPSKRRRKNKAERIMRHSIILHFSLFLLGCCAAVVNSAHAADLAWPKVTEETKPWSRWWWLGNIVTEDGLKSEMEKYASAGLGGLEITPIYGVRGKEDQFINYLSPQWVDRFE